MAVEFRFAIRSDVGLVRKNNQDSAYAGSRLLVVADGMGGAAGGDIASSVVIAHLAPLDDAPGPSDELLTNLGDALQSAHDELIERSDEDRSLKGMGTTCTALLRSENKLAMVHIGDSRAYLLRDKQLVQVTSDHSLVQYLVDTGRITKQEADTHPKRNVVLKILGDNPGPVLADATLREAVQGDRWLLCSDGLCGVVSDDTIAEVMNTIADLDECADELVNLALRAGGPDNITVVLADVAKVGSEGAQVPQVVGAAAAVRGIPTKGTKGAAGKAAALVATETEPTTDDDDEESHGKRRRLWVFLGILMVILILAAGALGLGYQWSQRQYYVHGSDGRVVVFQGIPQSLGSLNFSHPVEVTNLRLSELAEVDRQRLEDPVVRSSMDEVDQYLEELRGRIQLRAQAAIRATVDEDAPQSGDATDDTTGSQTDTDTDSQTDTDTGGGNTKDPTDGN